MPEPIHPSKLEEILKDVSNVPDPDQEFINSLRARFIAEGHASAQKNLEAPMKKKIFYKRPIWVFAMLMILVVILISPTVVNALKRLLGYVPNVGIIDQSTQVRVLAEPITQIREDYTVTIEQAVLNSEMTAVVYTYILPPNFVIPDVINIGFTEQPFIILPDGTRLDIITDRHVSQECEQCYMRYLMEFAPIAFDVTEVTLVIPDLGIVPSNTAPEDWRFQLKFKPADPSDIAPVIEQEITPMPTNIITDMPTPIANSYGITNNLDKFVQLPDGYILYGNTSWTDATIPPYGVNSILISIKDTNGKELSFDYADQKMYPALDELRIYWAYKIGTTDISAPLTLTFGVTASLPVDGGSFTFDPGINPQLGQTWNINQDVIVNNEVIHVLSAEQGGIEPGFFLFQMQSDSNIVGAKVIDLTYPPIGGGGGGGSMPEAKLPFYVGYGYQLPLPTPPYTLTFTNVQMIVPGDWELIWSP